MDNSKRPLSTFAEGRLHWSRLFNDLKTDIGVNTQNMAVSGAENLENTPKWQDALHRTGTMRRK
jgi:hypothetical protein